MQRVTILDRIVDRIGASDTIDDAQPAGADRRTDLDTDLGPADGDASPDPHAPDVD